MPSWLISSVVSIAAFHFSLRLFDGFGDEDRDKALGSTLVLLIRRVGFYRDIPEPLSLGWIYDLSNPHRIDFGLVPNFDLRLRLQVVIPKRMLWRSTLGGYEDIVIAVHDPH